MTAPMNSIEPISPFTITVFTRHSGDCPKRHAPQWKRCQCRKSLYIREHGKTVYVTAKRAPRNKPNVSPRTNEISMIL
jgi:hypothetical protein